MYRTCCLSLTHYQAQPFAREPVQARIRRGRIHGKRFVKREPSNLIEVTGIPLQRLGRVLVDDVSEADIRAPCREPDSDPLGQEERPTADTVIERRLDPQLFAGFTHNRYCRGGLHRRCPVEVEKAIAVHPAAASCPRPALGREANEVATPSSGPTDAHRRRLARGLQERAVRRASPEGASWATFVKCFT